MRPQRFAVMLAPTWQQILPIVPGVRAPTVAQHATDHVAGDKAFVDFSGKKIPIIDAATGAWCAKAEIFVSVLSVQSHLCGGNLDAGLTGLDWRACADVPPIPEGPVCWCRQSQEQRAQGLVL